MDLDRLLPHLGALSCLALAAVLSAPYLVVSGQPELLGAYYGAGPLGVAGSVFLAVLGVVIFLSGERGNADSVLVAGIMLAVGLAIVAITALWAVSLDPTLVFNFPSEYAWLESHRWVSLALSVVLAAVAAGYAAVTVE